ncbi:MAG: GNAT family N-acetyltransferase [Amphiplicatus sp.]
MKIVPYHPRYRSDFERLNRAWLEQYFTVERTDEKIFRDLDTVILEPGGEIFFAVIEGRAVGTCAMIPEGAGIYELGKMGVEQSVQGRGVGGALLDAATRWARDRAASKIVLMSNTRLEPAIRLYRRHGFLETTLPAHLQGAYARCDIYMELDLKPRANAMPQTRG